MNMRHLLAASLFIATLAGAASAQCYADYKAKREDPLRLHYGVIQLPAASCGSRDEAAREIERRIGRDGWQLLNVMSIFGADGLAERRDSAGPFFLRY